MTHLGINFNVNPGHFFTAYWRSSATAPYAWKSQCGRIAAAQDPDAAPGGQPLYDWAFWDGVLGQPFIAQGKGKLIVRVMETYASSGRTPLWMRNEGYAKPGTSDSWVYCQMQDRATVYMWQDIMAAFATRYRGDPRLAAMLFDETYPSLWEHQSLCGNLHGLNDGKAANAGLMEIMKAYLDVDPGMLWAIVNWFPAQSPVIETWEKGYDLGGGKQSLGADDLPGVQGHLRQDIKFFDNEGGGRRARSTPRAASFSTTCWPSTTPSRAARRSSSAMRPTAGSRQPERPSQRQPESLERRSVAGLGSAGLAAQRRRRPFPSTRFWVWYTSGAPRAATPAQQDSNSARPGPTPAGWCRQASTRCPRPLLARRPPAWNPSNLSIDKWLRAFDTFGPNGTRAMFNHPPGYLEQFAAGRTPRSPARTPAGMASATARTATATRSAGRRARRRRGGHWGLGHRRWLRLRHHRAARRQRRRGSALVAAAGLARQAPARLLMRIIMQTSQQFTVTLKQATATYVIPANGAGNPAAGTLGIDIAASDFDGTTRPQGRRPIVAPTKDEPVGVLFATDDHPQTLGGSRRVRTVPAQRVRGLAQRGVRSIRSTP